MSMIHANAKSSLIVAVSSIFANNVPTNTYDNTLEHAFIKCYPNEYCELPASLISKEKTWEQPRNRNLYKRKLKKNRR